MTMDTEYRKHHSEDMTRPLEPGPVLHWVDGFEEAVVFSCPCGEREIYATTRDGFRFEWDEQERLTIHGSCGYRAKPDLGRPNNWCHLFLQAGSISMCSDSTCPGGDL